MKLLSAVSFLPTLLLSVVIGGCGGPAPALTQNQIAKQSASTQQYKNKLKGMTKEQLAQEFRSDPERARTMLMPPGMGDPSGRLGGR